MSTFSRRFVRPINFIVPNSGGKQMKTFALAAAFGFAVATAAHAAPVTVDFEGFASGTDLTGATIGMMTLSAGGETIEVTDLVPGAGSSRAIQTNPFEGTNLFRADFSTSITAFSVDLGDFGPSDDDLLTIAAYTSGGTLLDSNSFQYGTAGSYLHTMSVAAANIGYVLFGGGSRQFPQSVFADNITYTAAVSTVPLPAGGLLLLSGLGAFAASRRRK